MIARKIYLRGDKALSSPLKSYVKFLRIVIPAVLFSALLMLFGLMKHLEAAELNSTLSFVNDYNNFSPSIIGILKDIFISTFFASSSYVGPLWTIQHQFFGTIVITAVAWFVSSLKKERKLAYMIIGLVFLRNSRFVYSFIIGAFAYDCVCFMDKDNSYLGILVRWLFSNKYLCYLCFAGGIYLSCVNSSLSGLWMWPLQKLPYQNPIAFRAIGISICLVCFESLPAFKKVFEVKILRYLGKLSSFIYIFHWPIILSLGCGVYILLRNVQYELAVVIISVVVFVVTLLLCEGYMRLLPMLKRVEDSGCRIIGSLLLECEKVLHMGERK